MTPSSIVIWICVIIISLLFINYSVKYHEDMQYIRHIQQIVGPAIPCIKYLYIRPGSYSRTYNKNIIFLKVRRPDGTFYDVHTVKYVLLHEVSHIICEVHDFSKADPHSPEFFAVFDEVKKLAYEAGVLEKKPIDLTY